MGNEPRRTRGERRRSRIAERARRIVEAEYSRSEGCDTRAIARRLGVSRARLCHCYREMYDSTIGQDLRARRIGLAQRLLDQDPARLVKEIANEVGYARRSYRTFFNSFLDVVGESPREYQRRIRARDQDEERQSRISSA